MIVQPPESTARRWAGALQARLSRAPLENFLQTSGLKITYAAGVKDTDNIAHAVIFIVRAGIDRYGRYYGAALSDEQQAAVAQTACAASLGIARLSGCEPAWRVAALLGITQLLAPFLGMNAAAGRSTVAVREFHDVLQACPNAADVVAMSHRAAEIVQRNESHFLEAMSWGLVRRLEARRSTALLPQVRALLG